MWKPTIFLCILMQVFRRTECFDSLYNTRSHPLYFDESKSIESATRNYHSALVSSPKLFEGNNFAPAGDDYNNNKVQPTNRPKRSFGILEALLGGGGYNSGGYYPTYSQGHSLGGVGGLLTPFYNKLAYSNPYLYSRYRYYGPGIYSSLFASRGFGFH